MQRTVIESTALILATLVYAGSVITNSQTANKPTKTADVKIRQRMGPANGTGVETVLYIKGPRMRSEMGGKFQHNHGSVGSQRPASRFRKPH